MEEILQATKKSQLLLVLRYKTDKTRPVFTIYTCICALSMSLSLEVCVLPPVFPSQHRTTAIHPRSLALTQKRPKQHVDACLPITGLKALVLSNNGDRLVLQGQGPYSRLIDEQSGRLLAELRTFKRNNVHGFLVFRQCLLEADEKKEYVHVLCWGGQSLRVIDLVVSIQEGTTEASLIPATAEYLAPDWILSGCVPSSSIDYYVKGSVAAVARVCLVTAHNALLDLQVEDMESSKYRKGIRLQQLETGVKSILYSADSVSLSPTHILVAAGTVFGEIIVWSCFLDDLKNTDGGDAVSSSSIHHFFTGHEGSIFGVEISPNIPALHGSQSGRLLASCSDDRTVRIWDISDCERTSRDEPSAYATDGFELRSTGFGCVPATDSLGSESCVAKAFGHEARIWGAHFLPLTMYNRGCRLISCGEDVACILWDLNWEESPSGADNFRLQQRSSFHQHSGKHIWSLDKCSVGVDTIVYTGGADGALKTSWISGNKTGEVKDEGRKGKASVIPTNDQAETDSRLRTFSFIASDCFLAISLSGEVKLGWIGSGMTKTESGMKPDITWETICVEKDLCSFSIISALPEKRMALLSNIQGLIRLYDHRSKSLFTVAQAERPQEIHFLLPKSDSSSADVPDTLYFVTYNPVADETKLFKVGKWQTETPHVEQFTLALLPPFWASCASFICGKQYIALGSRGGAFVIYRFPDSGQSEQPLQPLISLRRVHGKASINLIMSIASFHDDHGMLREYILTCGRDGAYCLHEIQTTNDPTKPVMLTTIHRSSSPITDIERVYFDKTSRDLILYGFRGREFVLWNESTQSEIASIECGGIRRSWAFHPGATDTASRGLFLWNKTSDFNAQFIQSRSHRVLRAGGHGREIKCMAVCNHAKSDGGALFATGAEDTAVRIWALTDSCVEGPWGIFKCLRVTNKHTSGLQQISWSNDGKYLFTSGGWEEFFVWRIRSIPVFGATAELLASSPKDDERSDLRVTSFDMLDVEEQGTDQSSFLFCLTYSNSTIKVCVGLLDAPAS